MKSELVGKGDDRTFTVTFGPGEEAVEGLQAFAQQEGIELAAFEAIGGFEQVDLGFFNLETRGFDPIDFDADQVEVLSLMGEITPTDDGLVVHGHVVVATRNGSAYGGHLLRGIVRPILIVTLRELTDYSGSHH